jgi:hypothetical protein
MKFLAITALLMMSLNALACDGSSKGKTEEQEEDKDQRTTVIR